MDWNVSPVIFDLGPLSLRWYGILFMGGFVAGYFVLKKQLRRDLISVQALDDLLFYILFGAIIGARLGHVLFYEPEKYLAHPLEILKIWHGGLASHGSGIGMMVAIVLFCRKYPKFNFWWVLDQICLLVPLTGAFIRTGNLMNSEIIGKETDLPWAFRFLRVDNVPRHPTQIYEALSYLLIFWFVLSIYKKGKMAPFISGLVFILVFSARFFLEFFKENQVEFESDLFINMGQFLSIPFVLVGIYFLFLSKKRKKQGHKI